MNGLPAIAKNLAARGRNGDSVLVHMTPGEVRGLQAIAEQHGTSLTINPDTGLPEAFSLRSLLPMIAGIALTPIMGPMAAGMTVGGIEAVRTGDIGKGLMAGLGAYGGANLGAGLGVAGASSQAATLAPEITASQFAASPTATIGNAQYLATPLETGGSFISPIGAAGVRPDAASFMLPETGIAQAVNTPMASTYGGQLSQIGQGFKALGTEPGRAAFMSNIGNYSGLAKSAGMAAAPMLAEAMTPKPFKPVPEEESTYEGPYTPTPREVRYPTEQERRRIGTGEFMYFNPSNPVPFQEGGDVGMNVTPAEAEVYRNIANVQRMAGIPSIANIPMTVAPQRDVSSLVYNPVGYAASEMPRIEQNYGFAPFMTKEQADKAVAESLRKDDGSGIQEIIGYTANNEPYKNGGVPMLEDGGFVLTKKAIDGLGKGNNKKGQKVASRGLGAIPIKGPGHGTSDSIRTTIEGKQPALVSNGEAYVPRKQVERKGGAKKFYALMRAAERRA